MIICLKEILQNLPPFVSPTEMQWKSESNQSFLPLIQYWVALHLFSRFFGQVLQIKKGNQICPMSHGSCLMSHVPYSMSYSLCSIPNGLFLMSYSLCPMTNIQCPLSMSNHVVVLQVRLLQQCPTLDQIKQSVQTSFVVTQEKEPLLQQSLLKCTWSIYSGPGSVPPQLWGQQQGGGEGAVVARYKMKPNLFLTKSLVFLWSSNFSGHFKLLVKVDGNILDSSLGHSEFWVTLFKHLV